MATLTTKDTVIMDFITKYNAIMNTNIPLEETRKLVKAILDYESSVNKKEKSTPKYKLEFDASPPAELKIREIKKVPSNSNLLKVRLNNEAYSILKGLSECTEMTLTELASKMIIYAFDNAVMEDEYEHNYK